MCTVAASSQCIICRTTIHCVPLSFSENPNNSRDSVHLEEDVGVGGLELQPLACVRRSVCGMLYADDAGIVPKEPCEDECHCDRFRISRSHRARAENGGNDAPHTQQGFPGLTARCLYTQTMHFLYLWARSYQRKRRHNATKLTTDTTRVGMLRWFQGGHATIVSSGSCTIWKMLRSN